MRMGKEPENLNPLCMLMDDAETGWQTHTFLKLFTLATKTSFFHSLTALRFYIMWEM